MRLSLLFVLSCIFSSPAFAEDQQLPAREAANAWLALVDAGAYAQSWQTAASLFKQNVASQAWQQAVSAAREPLGEVKVRELVSYTHTTSLPGAPDGEYVVIQFQTEFVHKAEAIEMVTPMLDGDSWRVSGYFVK